MAMLPILTTPGQRLKWYRRSQGLSRITLGGLAGLHPQTLYAFEADRAVISLKSLQALAKALGVSCAHILGEVGLLDDFTPVTQEHANATQP